MDATPDRPADAERPRILITGATGYVGGRLLRSFEADGIPVVCMLRRPRALRHAAPTTSTVIADVLEPERLNEALVESAKRELGYFEEVGFDNVKISVKASDVPLMVGAYRLLADTVDYPLHLGVTEAGPPPAGIMKATAGIATLLLEGIGHAVELHRVELFEGLFGQHEGSCRAVRSRVASS